jgi:hypothetical protein
MDDVFVSAGRLKAWLRDFGRAKSGAVWCDDLERVIEAAIATAEQARHSQKLGNQLEAVAGALADAGNAFTTNDYGEAVRELTRERDELRAERDALLNAATVRERHKRIVAAESVAAEQTRRLQILSSCMDGVIGALADAKTVLCIRQDGDYAASVRELTRERDAAREAANANAAVLARERAAAAREIDRLAELVERFGEAATFTREAIRDNLKEYQYKNEPLLLEAFNKCDDALLCAATSRPRAALEAAMKE